MGDHETTQESVSRLDLELRRRKHEVEQFVYTVSHDLKSPLVTITGFLGLLERSLEAGDREGVERAVDRIRRSADRMSEMIEGLLRLSRLGRVARQTTAVDVDGALRELLLAYEERLEAAGAIVELGEPLPGVQANRELLVQVFDNLLANALEHADDGDLRIRIGHRLTDHELQYRFEDNGPGIPPAEHTRVFRVFERLDADGDGTGMGLAIVDRILSAHDGHVRLESQPGEGATFVLAFPRRAAVRASGPGTGDRG